MPVYRFLLNANKNGEIKYQFSGFVADDNKDLARESAQHYGILDCPDHEIVVNDIYQVNNQYFGVEKKKFTL